MKVKATLANMVGSGLEMAIEKQYVSMLRESMD